MTICRIEDYKRLILSYDSCFSALYPELKFYCDDEIFSIKGINRKYTDISGVNLDMEHFIVAIKHEYMIFLPIAESATYKIKKMIDQLLN